jgi:UDP-GlcNAc3NAcA epimerase
MTTRIVTVIGARPQFIKAAAVSRAIAHEPSLVEVLVHTGQHADDNMSAAFLRELDMPTPAHDLGISGGTHGEMTGRMLEAIEKVLVGERPDVVLVYGDTNSTLAGALAAAKLGIPVAHVEAGLRSFNRRMPEEINRILVDRLATLLYCPTDAAVENLTHEGITVGVHNVGDVMYDAALFFGERAHKQSDALRRLDLSERGFVLATCHRAENTDDPVRLAAICDGLARVAETMRVVLPVHPRLRKMLGDPAARLGRVTLTDPLPFLDMIALERAAAVIVTDSGGVQKEAFFYGVPCVTLRDETEWVETVTLGRNRLVGADAARIVDAVAAARAILPQPADARPYGTGHAAEAIVARLALRK